MGSPTLLLNTLIDFAPQISDRDIPETPVFWPMDLLNNTVGVVYWATRIHRQSSSCLGKLSLAGADAGSENIGMVSYKYNVHLLRSAFWALIFVSYEFSLAFPTIIVPRPSELYERHSPT